MSSSRRPPSEWQGKARRITSRTESGISTADQIAEYDASGSVRVVNRSLQRGQPVNSEMIAIGDNSFVRRNDGPWERKPRTPNRNVDPPVAPFESLENSYRFMLPNQPGVASEFALSSGTYKGRDMTVVLRVERSKRVDPAGGREVSVEIRIKYWLDNSKRLVRSEQWDIQIVDGKKHKSYVSLEWEADPSITIKEPAGASSKPR